MCLLSSFLSLEPPIHLSLLCELSQIPALWFPNAQNRSRFRRARTRWWAMFPLGRQPGHSLCRVPCRWEVGLAVHPPPLLLLRRGHRCVVPRGGLMLRGGSFAPSWLQLQSASAVCPVQHPFNAQWPSFNSHPCTTRRDTFRGGWHGLPSLLASG